MNVLKTKLWLLVIASTSSVAWGGDLPVANFQSTRPATFINGPKDFRRHIVFPKNTPDSGPINISILCNAGVTAQGRFKKYNYCFSKPGQSREYERVVHAAMQRGRMSPAVIKGRPREVWLMLLVIFHRDGPLSEVMVHLNDGQSAFLLGDDYIGPQSYAGADIDWRGCKMLGAVFAEGVVGVDGRMRNISFDMLNTENGCEEKFQDYLNGAKYIPAYNDGEWVWSSALEVFMGRGAFSGARVFSQYKAKGTSGT